LVFKTCIEEIVIGKESCSLINRLKIVFTDVVILIYYYV